MECARIWLNIQILPIHTLTKKMLKHSVQKKKLGWNSCSLLQLVSTKNVPIICQFDTHSYKLFSISFRLRPFRMISWPNACPFVSPGTYLFESHQILPRGPSIKYVRPFFAIFDTPFPHASTFLCRSVIIFCHTSFFLNLWPLPLCPLPLISADVFYG